MEKLTHVYLEPYGVIIRQPILAFESDCREEEVELFSSNGLFYLPYLVSIAF